jgi:hypothetical protein
MPVNLAKPTDARENMLTGYVERTGLSFYFARQQYRDGLRWAARANTEERANIYASPLVAAKAPMTVFVVG